MFMGKSLARSLWRDVSCCWNKEDKEKVMGRERRKRRQHAWRGIHSFILYILNCAISQKHCYKKWGMVVNKTNEKRLSHHSLHSERQIQYK